MDIRSKPLSPHLGIYKPQITSVLSIMHRLSGVAIFFGLVFLLWWLVGLAYGQNPTSSLLWPFFNSVYGKIIMYFWSYALFFHMCTGIRHLLWDCGIGFGLKFVNLSGWTAVIVSMLLNIASWYCALQFQLGGGQ